MTPEAKREASRKGGTIAGEKTFAEGTGLFGMTPEAKSEASRKGGTKHFAGGTGMFRMTEDGRRLGEVAKEEKHKVSMSQQNAMANRSAGYKPPQWATGDASGSGS
jgi:hypothetical protein